MPIPIYGDPSSAAAQEAQAAANQEAQAKAGQKAPCADIKLVDSFVKRGIAILSQLNDTKTKDIASEHLAILKDDISIAFHKISDKELVGESSL